MSLPPSGTISLTTVLNELRIANPNRSAVISLGDADVLALAGKGSPPISLTDLYGRSAYTPMSGTLSNVHMTGMAGNTGAMYNETESLTVSLSGGAAPYTFAWSKVSGSGSVDAVNSASTVVRMPVQRFGTAGDVSTQVVHCLVTDAKGNTLTRQCTVTMTLN
jgi:hypothetical protein